MKKTFVTDMPNHIGAFLKASRCFAKHGVNITRVSYNKAVDSHKLFIDAEGTAEQLLNAAGELTDIGYLTQEEARDRRVYVMEFKLRDVPGSVMTILEHISDFAFNISYISSQDVVEGYRGFKIGVVSDDPEKVERFLAVARRHCEVSLVDYNPAERVYDNSLFYSNFVTELAALMDIDSAHKEELLVNANLAMQQLDESGVLPYRTFDTISRFSELLAESRGANFRPRVSRHTVTPNTEIVLIEPPCGSNTAVIKSFDKYLFVDSGYGCYREEMLTLLRSLIPNYDTCDKSLFVTHADVDHIGLLPEFPVVYAGVDSAECMRLARQGKDDLREQVVLHKPYIRICKILTDCPTAAPETIRVIGEAAKNDGDPLERTGSFDFGDLHFELYQGAGGHLKGENVLIDYTNRLVFSGDIFVNLKDMTPQQADYNRCAPILMTSVDTDPKLCLAERRALFARLGAGTWQIFGGHGAKKTYTLNVGE
ncbi:MAG: Zn-dependent hydrolase [Clostridia bacterium]|nr:Zn-dependent hydrolase [Clostridia bacterium]